MRTILLCGVMLASLSVAVQAEVQVINSVPAPNQIRPELVVLSPDWTARIPPSGRVNPPDFCTSLYSGQKVALGLLAQGPDRDQLLKTATLDASYSSGGAVVGKRTGLKPVAIRQIKAEGADVSLMVLKAGGLSAADVEKMAQATSLTSLAVFVPDWTLPTAEGATEIVISTHVSGTVIPVTMEPARLKIRTLNEWLAGPTSVNEISTRMQRCCGDLPPGQLVSWLATATKIPKLDSTPLPAFFALTFKTNVAAREAAVAAYPTLETESQIVLLWMLRLGGLELTTLFPSLSAETVAQFKTVKPLADPRHLPSFKDPVDLQEMSRIGVPMDQCWASWTATGDPTYLRALVDLLASAPDFPIFESWQKTRGGAKGLNAQVANGLRYQIAGWSIGSFQRTDPRVADWLLYWQDDPSVPETIRREIASLPSNPAFQRK